MILLWYTLWVPNKQCVVYDNNIEVHVKCNACTAMSVDTGSTVSNAMNFDNRAQKFFFKKNVKANFQGHGVVLNTI